MLEYVEKRNGGLYLAGSRVSLDSVVISFQQGASPESILRSFPAIGSLEKVYGAVTFYLANKQLVEDYLLEQSQLWDRTQAQQEPLPGALQEKIDRARTGVTRP